MIAHMTDKITFQGIHFFSFLLIINWVLWLALPCKELPKYEQVSYQWKTMYEKAVHYLWPKEVGNKTLMAFIFVIKTSIPAVATYERAWVSQSTLSGTFRNRTGLEICIRSFASSGGPRSYLVRAVTGPVKTLGFHVNAIYQTEKGHITDIFYKGWTEHMSRMGLYTQSVRCMGFKWFCPRVPMQTLTLMGFGGTQKIPLRTLPRDPAEYCDLYNQNCWVYSPVQRGGTLIWPREQHRRKFLRGLHLVIWARYGARGWMWLSH